MNKKEIYVVFSPTNARILINPEEPLLYEGRDDVIKNPDLTNVQGIPPHFWKVQNYRIVSMTEAEKKQRQKIIDETVSHYPVVNELVAQVDHFKKVIEHHQKLIDTYVQDKKELIEGHEWQKQELGRHHIQGQSKLRTQHDAEMDQLATAMNAKVDKWKKMVAVSLPFTVIVSLYIGHFIH